MLASFLMLAGYIEISPVKGLLACNLGSKQTLPYWLDNFMLMLWMTMVYEYHIGKRGEGKRDPHVCSYCIPQ